MMAIMLLFVFYKIVSRLPTDVVARLSTTPESEILLSIKKGVCLTTFCCFMTPPRQKLTCYCLTSAHLWLPYFQTKIFFSLISLLLGHWYEIMALYYVKSILTEISASIQDRRVLQKCKIIRIKFLSIWGMLQTSRYV